MGKIIMIFTFIIFSLNCFSQKTKITKRPDGKSIFIQGKFFSWFDASGSAISKVQFNDSLKTGNYKITLIPVDTLSSKFYLTNKYPNKSEIIGMEVPLLIYTDISGKEIKVGGTANISILIFWSITCASCIQELIVFNALAKEYPNFDFYAITTESKANVVDFLNKKNYKWGNIVIIPDYKPEDYNPGIDVYPSCLLINKKRIVQDVCFKENIRQTIALMEILDKQNK